MLVALGVALFGVVFYVALYLSEPHPRPYVSTCALCKARGLFGGCSISCHNRRPR